MPPIFMFKCLTSPSLFFALLLSTGTPSTAVATVVATPSLYEYFISLGDSIPAQVGSEPWTFHFGDQNAELLPEAGGSSYGFASPIFVRFGEAADTGQINPIRAAGTAGPNEAPGIFVHTASDRPVAAVMHVFGVGVIPAIRIRYELVHDGDQGNGIEFTLRTIQNGTIKDHVNFVITNTINEELVIPLDPGDQLFNPGDRVVALFGPNGTTPQSQFFDQGWFDLAIIPEPSVPMLLSIFASGMLVFQRRRSRGSL